MRPIRELGTAGLQLIAVASLSAFLAAVPALAGETSAPMQVLQRARWVAEGGPHPRHVLYIFVDANCPFCHELWLALQPYYSKGLQVRDLMVGIIAPSSAGKAAAILDARNPAAALHQNELDWGARRDGAGGIEPVAQPSNADRQILAYDLTLMRAFGVPGTPGLVYADARGQVHVVEGTPGPQELEQIIAAAAVPAR